MSRGLAYERAPAIDVPLRFLLAAPLFALLAAAPLIYYGPALLVSRWSPALLALTHLVALGFIAHSIVGALLQYLPVAAGADLRHLHRAAPWLQVALTAGTLLLVAGFSSGSAPLLRSAGWLLALTLGAFMTLTTAELMRGLGSDATTRAVALALAGLGATIAFGFVLAALPAQATGWGTVRLTNLHAAWGLIGWVTLTVLGVGLVVVPMFQLAPRYPAALERGLPWLLIGALIVLTIAVTSSLRTLAGVSYALVAIAIAAFGVATLRLQHASRRSADVTVWLWRGGMASLIATALLIIGALAAPALPQQPWFELLLAVLMLAGFAMSVIIGMMYKIVPFLIWLHLQQVNALRRPLPHMRQIIAQRPMRWQASAHGIAVALLIAALAWPPAVYGAGVAWAASQLLLATNLGRALRLYAALRRSLTAPA